MAKSSSPKLLLKIRNIETFYGAVMAIRGVSLDVEEGRIVTILGANGAGKTTLLKTICGVMDPEKGRIEFQGEEIQGLEPDKIVRKGIVHVPEGREIFPFLNVEENLMMGAYTRRDKQNFATDLAMVHDYFPILKERASQQAGYLSGGQQQMLAIGRGLMSKPKLMLMDEPSLGLSPILVQEIFTIIRRLNKEQGVTILLVEQNANVALKAADYGYVLEIGRIVMDDTSEKLLASPDVQEFYLGLQEEGQRDQKRWKRRKTWR